MKGKEKVRSRRGWVIPARWIGVSLLVAGIAAGGVRSEGPPREPAPVPEHDLLEDLKSAPRDNEARVHRLLSLYEAAGAVPETIRLQPVPVPARMEALRTLPALHNVVVTKRGTTDGVIVVGGHLDKAEAGDGVIDNWSGACLVKNLYRALRDVETRHTFVFVGFAYEEYRMLGSKRFVESLSAAERKKVSAMINFDSLGVDDPFLFSNGSTDRLEALAHRVARDNRLPLQDHVVAGVTDSVSFEKAGIPVLSFDGLSLQNFHLIHSKDDTFAAIRPGCYVAAYRLAIRVLLALDGEAE